MIFVSSDFVSLCDLNTRRLKTRLTYRTSRVYIVFFFSKRRWRSSLSHFLLFDDTCNYVLIVLISNMWVRLLIDMNICCVSFCHSDNFFIRFYDFRLVRHWFSLFQIDFWFLNSTEMWSFFIMIWNQLFLRWRPWYSLILYLCHLKT